MKLTKTLALAALVGGGLLAGNATLQAQDNTNTPPAAAPAPHTHPNFEKVAQELGLTDDQKTKFKAVLADQQTQLRSLRADTSLAPEDKRAKAKEIRAATLTQLKTILTPDQLAKWQNLMQHAHPSAATGGTPPSAPPQQ
jgi:Spy/CpxP family protein refolding chaperone